MLSESVSATRDCQSEKHCPGRTNGNPGNDRITGDEGRNSPTYNRPSNGRNSDN